MDTVPLKVIVLIANLEPKWKEVSTTTGHDSCVAIKTFHPC